MKSPRRFGLAFAAAVILATCGLAAAKEIPPQLPKPDGKPPDLTKPVKVFILAGQSNMVGMGEVRGARCRYTGIYLTADPAAPQGPLYIGRAVYKIAPLGIYRTAEPGAEKGATVSVYPGAFDPGVDYDKVKPAKTQPIAFGVTQGTLPTVPGAHTCIVRGYLEVPESGTYVMGPGYGDSTCNLMELAGREVYRKEPGSRAARQKVRLKAGQRYPFRITYFKDGSTAFWMSRLDLTGKGDLEAVTKRDGKFPNLLDEKGNWTVRNDVYYYDARVKFTGGPLTVPPPGSRTIGPELQFGHVMGYYYDEPVLLIKTAMGNRALAWDFRPPSSGRKKPGDKWEGLEYRLMVEGVRKALDNLAKIIPNYEGQGYEIAGFVWWQGHKDSFNEAWIREYEQNLVNLIKDVRAEFKVPRLPVVVATVGFGGLAMPPKFRKIWEAQMAVGDPKKHPELAGTVRSVDTREFWRDVDESPANQDYHYNRNAETYLLVGDAVGRAMVDLLEGRQPRAAPAPKPFKTPPSPAPSTRTEAEKAKARAALSPVILDGMVPEFVARNRDALLREANAEPPERPSPFLRDTTYALTEFYRAAGIHDYDWHPFGPDLRNTPWFYFSFDPPEKMPKDNGRPRFRKVTCPKGMENWFAVDFDPAKAGWQTGLPPFGQKGGKLEPLRETCTSPFCGCSIPPRTLWEKEVLLVRKTFECPPLKKGHRYRIVVGGSAHVNAGEGYAIYVNGKKLFEYPYGVGKRQGGQPRGAFIYKDFLKEFQGGKVTVAAMSFLRFYHPAAKRIPPQGHFSLWLEEMRIPPLKEEAPPK